MKLINLMRKLIWGVVLSLFLILSCVTILGACVILKKTVWANFGNIFQSMLMLTGLIIFTFIVGGAILWMIREDILPLSTEEMKTINRIQEEKK